MHVGYIQSNFGVQLCFVVINNVLLNHFSVSQFRSSEQNNYILFVSQGEITITVLDSDLDSLFTEFYSKESVSKAVSVQL